MPHLTLQISAGGPILDCYIGVSAPRAEALKKAGLAIPKPFLIRALVDTGASCTNLDPSILTSLGVASTGIASVHTPSTKSGIPHVAKQYDVSLTLPHPLIHRTFNALAVIESELLHQGIQGLIGRDILNACMLTYDGTGKTFTFGF